MLQYLEPQIIDIPDSIKEIVKLSTTVNNIPTSKKYNVYKTDESEDFLSKYNLTIVQLFYLIKNNLNHIPLCKHCGKRIEDFYNPKKASGYCSKKCLVDSGEWYNIIKKANIEKYGVENIFQLESVKKKIKQTNIEKYGCEVYTQTDEYKKKSKDAWNSKTQDELNEIREKSKQTCLERYGVEHSSQNDDIKEKVKKTNLERYGVECTIHYAETNKKIRDNFKEKYGVDWYSKTDEYKQRIKDFSLENYGCEHYIKSQKVIDKMKETNLERYGVENPFANDDIKEKIKETSLERYGVEHYTQTEEYKERHKETHRKSYYELHKEKLLRKHIEILDTKEEYIINDLVHYKCLICNNTFESSELNDQHVFCPHCTNNSYSIAEKELLEWIKSIYSGEVIDNDRTILNGKELDIYIPEKKLAIEYNGDYWHSTIKKDKQYHKEKSLECRKQGIRLIHIFEYEWSNKQEICKSIIKSALGIYDRRIYARQCVAKEISANEYRNFLDINHLQGSTNSSIRYGLFYNDELVAVIGFGKSRFKKNEIELHRFCCKLNYSVIGAFSKLIKHSGVNNFITYVDLAHFTGDGYKKIGFTEMSVTEPNYKWVKGMSVLNRFSTQKHKLAKLLGENYNPDLTEDDNMLDNGYNKVYDSGNIKMVYKGM